MISPLFATFPGVRRRRLLAACAGMSAVTTAGGLVSIALVMAAPAGESAPAASSVYARRAAATPSGPATAEAEHGAGAQPPSVARAGAGQGDTARGEGAAGDAAERAAQAERIVASAIATFSRVGSFSARIRQKARIGPRVLVGTGRYLQTGQGEEQKYRFESTLESDSESFELLELSDGLFAWTYRRDGPQPPTLYRTDVRRVRDRLVELGCPTPDHTAGYLGGFARVLWLTRQWMRFTAAEAGEIDGLPMWLINGSWSPGGLAATGPPLQGRVKKGETITPADLPDGVPWSVRLAIGTADLVPRRIEWLAIPGERPVPVDAPLEPIAVFELFDIELDGPIDPASFYYQPAVTGLMDVTDQHVKTLALFRP